VAVAIQNHLLTESVQIFVEYGPFDFFRDDFDRNMLVSDFKKEVASKVGIDPSLQEVVDSYANTVQDNDGMNEFLDSKKLSDYGITSQPVGKLLCVLKKVSLGAPVPDCKNQLSIIYGPQNVIRIPLKEKQTILELRTWLSVQLKMPLPTLLLVDWYSNPITEADGGIFLDTKTIGDYGYTLSGKRRVINISTFVPTTASPYNTQPGILSLTYGPLNVQAHLPINGSQTVLQFRDEVYAITGVKQPNQLLYDFHVNQAQNQDNGAWKNEKLVSAYIAGQPRVDLTVVNGPPQS